MTATLKTTIIQEPSSASSNIQLDANGNTYLVPVTGNVGIGTISPGNKLVVSNNTSSAPAGPSSTIASIIGADNGTSRLLIDSFGASASSNLSLRRAFGTAASPSAITSADSILGTVAAFGYGATGYSSTNRANVGFYTAESWTDTAQGAYVSFTTTATGSTTTSERMRIDSSGNLLVGTTNSVPGNGSGNNVSGFSANNNGTTWCSRSGFYALSANRVDITGGVIELNSAGNAVGSISVTSSATAYNTSSDYRLKENVTPMMTGLTTVSALKPVNYDWIKDKSEGEGFIAHELQAIIPHAVTGVKDAVDDEGRPVYQGVDYSKIVVHLVAAIQEQQATITSLTARIATLEAK